MRQLFLLSFYIFLFVLLPLTKTVPQEDPWGIVSTGPRTVNSQDVFLLFMNHGGGSTYQKIYRYKTEGIAIPNVNLDYDTMLTATDTKTDSRQGSDRQVDVATGRFNVDPYDDVVDVWRTQGNTHKIEISLPVFDSSGIFNSIFAYTLDAGEEIRQDDNIYVKTGDFDGDGLDEFVVTALNLSNHILYFIFDIDTINGSLQPVFIQKYTSLQIVSNYPADIADKDSIVILDRYVIETADLNSDGIDEIVSFNIEGGTSNSTYIPAQCRVYTFENGKIAPRGIGNFQVKNQSNFYQSKMSAAKGQFIPGTNEELVFSSVTSSWFKPPYNLPLEEYHAADLFILDAYPDLDHIQVKTESRVDLRDHACQHFTDFGLAAGDLNRDGRDEIVYIAGKKIRITKVEDNNSITLKGHIGIANGGEWDYAQSNNYLKVKDINMDNREDIIVQKSLPMIGPSTDRGFWTYFITMGDALDSASATVLGRFPRDVEGNYDYRKYAIAVGNFDGLDFKVGYPYPKVTVPGLQQPVMLLNAPPTHFDKFGNDIFDVNGCYNGNCNFTASYELINDITMGVSTSVNRDWAISAGLKSSGKVTLGPFAEVDYEAHLLGKYGRHYSKDSGHKKTVSYSSDVSTTRDDQIFYTSTDYDFWEYPIYHGNETFPRRTFLVADPQNTVGEWSPSKSLNTVNYAPDHEIDNILSYYSDVSINPNVADTIRVRYGTTKYLINNNSTFGWDLIQNDFTNNSASTTREAGVDLGLSFGLVEFKGDFSRKEMVTNTTTVEHETKIHIDFGSTNSAIPQTDYRVLPYAYWATNGALVVDYAVNPALGPPGGFETWWQVMYSDKPDLSFILPWKLDPEKGIRLNDEAQRFSTQDIIFSDRNPAPGDTLTITARVRNFSLMPTSDSESVSVSFFLNDPDSGGTPLIGINGTNSVSADAPIPARGRLDVEFKWIFPGGLAYPRIYAILDKDNTIDEIHEENNKGLNILGLGTISDVGEENNIVPEEYVLYQSYPNPFNPSTIIKYSIPKSDKVSIKVYDILGSEVALLTNEYKSAGTYSVEFNANRFASGVYFYQIRTGNFVETKKMVLLK